ncbi:biotin--[acetyl-CoA-carboxylase] ligase [Nesterenkonia lutea]|uniref:BirA family biotin operon repressor/biotin-[acetyl-CoA-carboxylase] ligase n=1 Tax=Nesterenkonia lutea TaxID=272919 RepID=A0ABR9JBB9_9MICC|nr:biotin--[acetyl-CoA-carboxylase] ligase [Nesterenkonia lutea]MBE1523121.1 BirA family biotin operon repressor/biotin-[acetyl-CoA-carboxylase] ligase [Nesterenkonia lutea]
MTAAPPPLHALPALDIDLLRRRLLRGAGGGYARVERIESVGSTNQHLLDALAADDAATASWPHLSVLTAEEQTGGRGRLGRVWTSPRGASLSTSIVLRPRLDPTHLGWLSMLAGRTLVDTLREDHGLDTASQRAVLKWPNDVQVTQPVGAEKKISGILAAAVPAMAGSGPSAVVLGIGINVLLQDTQLPTENATSVLIELRRAANGPVPAELGGEEAARLRTELLCGFLERFALRLHAVEELASRDPEGVSVLLREQVGEVLSTLGQQVRVELPHGGAERGVARSLGPDGSLQVQVSHVRSGLERDWTVCEPVLRSFSAGDVVHLRPSP